MVGAFAKSDAVGEGAEGRVGAFDEEVTLSQRVEEG